MQERGVGQGRHPGRRGRRSGHSAEANENDGEWEDEGLSDGGGGAVGGGGGGTVGERGAVGGVVREGDKNKGGMGGGAKGGEVAKTETGAATGETRRGDSAGGSAGMVTDATEEHVEPRVNTATAA